MKTRLQEFDYIRVVAALSVILIHITSSYSASSRFAYYCNQSVRYAVPMFILISGLLLNYSTIGKNLKYTVFLSKRLKKILVPYIIWTFIYFLFKNRSSIHVIWDKKKELAVLLSKNLIFGTGYAHLYFVVIILQLYFLYPLLKAALEKKRAVTLAVSFSLTLFFQTAIYLSLMGILKLPRFFIPYYIFFPTWLFYFVFGMAVSLKIDVLREKISKYTIPAAITWVACLLILFTDNRFTGTYDSSMKPSVILYCFASFFFFYAVFVQFKDRRGKIGDFINWLSAQSYMLYLSHLLVLNLIRIAFKHAGLAAVFKGIPGMLILFAATTLLSIVFIYIASLTPFAGLLGGVRSTSDIRFFNNKSKSQNI